MKSHLLGILILVMSFAVGFSASPIRFSSFAVGSDEHGGFTAYQSTDFVNLSSTTERYETSEEAMEVFENHKRQFSRYIDKQEIIEAKENRTIISFQSKYIKQGFCLIRREDYKLYEICSASLRHILEFEKQTFDN